MQPDGFFWENNIGVAYVWFKSRQFLQFSTSSMNTGWDAPQCVTRLCLGFCWGSRFRRSSLCLQERMLIALSHSISGQPTGTRLLLV
ncbi:hypothetical protein EUGRSUZ_L00446 [Eucalyptus grandis]|uniref:Uncharacterized protein n=1 Tax=Eucalyptus grandis TaxID=71139 RepID=A0A058ZWK8_EUCGR|nr:hypothetical protein EUGRSUZ_L00446 [Eucalyptus grandis]